MQQGDLNLIKLGNKVKELREKTNLSLNGLVFKKGGVTTATWSRIENGKVNVRFATLIKVCAVLGITLEELLDGVDLDYSIDE